MAKYYGKTIFDYSRGATDELPDVSEVDVVRHYTKLSTLNYGVDNGFYPLGSCTMKYNPKINEELAALEGFANLHPLQQTETIQGILELLFAFEQRLCELFGYSRFTLQPAAGAHGEQVGMLIMRAYHLKNGDVQRTKILVPDSSHGTNPASAAVAGFKLVTIPSQADGGIDLVELKKQLNDEVAGLMLTNPNTLGLFDKNILEVSKLVHACGGLLYYDGANANAIMGIAKPAEMGFDICHLNLHKTFGTPHGGGGPGSGPVGVVARLVPFLPQPVINYDAVSQKYFLDNDLPESLGKVHGFYGNIGVAIKAYVYYLANGSAGLKQVSQQAVINANYIKARLQNYYDIPYQQHCQHEFVISLKNAKKEFGVTAADVAKRLMDYGYHPPTIYFPLIINECLMIEPTETESKSTLDDFCEAMINISTEISKTPELLKQSPQSTVIKRLDEVKAVKEPQLQYFQ